MGREKCHNPLFAKNPMSVSVENWQKIALQVGEKGISAEIIIIQAQNQILILSR